MTDDSRGSGRGYGPFPEGAEPTEQIAARDVGEQGIPAQRGPAEGDGGAELRGVDPATGADPDTTASAPPSGGTPRPHYGGPAPTTGYPKPEPTAGHPSPAPTTGYPSPEPTAGHPSPAPTAGHPSPAPTAGHPSPAPTTSHPSPAPTTGHPSPEPANGYPSPEPPSGYPSSEPTSGYPGYGPATPTSGHPGYGPTTPTSGYPSYGTAAPTSGYPGYGPATPTSGYPDYGPPNAASDYDPAEAARGYAPYGTAEPASNLPQRPTSTPNDIPPGTSGSTGTGTTDPQPTSGGAWPASNASIHDDHSTSRATPDPYGFSAPPGRRIEPSPPPDRNRLIIGILAGLAAGLVLFGTAGWFAGRATAPAAESAPTETASPQPSPTPSGQLGVFEQNQVTINRPDFAGTNLTTLAEGWLPYLATCTRNNTPGGPALNAGERFRVRCTLNGMSAVFVEYKSTAERDKARVRALGQAVDARSLTPGVAPAAERSTPSGRTTGNYVEYAYRLTERGTTRTVSGIWWDDAQTPVAGYLLAYWKDGVGESWEPMRDLWSRYA